MCAKRKFKMKVWIEDIGAFIGLIGFSAVLVFFYMAF